MKTINQQHFYLCFNISTKHVLLGSYNNDRNYLFIIGIYVYIPKFFFRKIRYFTTQNKNQNHNLNKNISSNKCERVKAKRVFFFFFLIRVFTKLNVVTFYKNKLNNLVIHSKYDNNCVVVFASYYHYNIIVIFYLFFRITIFKFSRTFNYY